MNISKENFVKAIRSIKESSDFTKELNDLFRKFDCDGIIMSLPDCTGTVVELLELLTDDTVGFINYFCWEENFGENYKSGDVEDWKGDEIPLSTPEELYELLAQNDEVITSANTD